MRTVLYIFVGCCILFSCTSPSNRRAVNPEDLETVQATDSTTSVQYTPQRAALSAPELIALADCRDLPCVQLYMKDRDRDFVHASKGMFAAQYRSAITDTAGNEWVLPLSTFYVSAEPQSSWRAAHTVHRQELANQLAAAFDSLEFRLADSAYYLGLADIQKHYTSTRFPGKHLYITATYMPWYKKGLYAHKVTWPCYVFEVYNQPLYIGAREN
ncbi:hypothetical protein [Niabella sp.]|uniref:hypothetical protein n=1 Tax=Niabella sp. TaxID=1962976 RepID=UPI002614F0C0|nr:hypothetical protein [Niabella sp.]